MAKRLQLRRDTESNWSSVNPTLLQGEVALTIDASGKTIGQKIGDGTTPWKSLEYIVTKDSQLKDGTVTTNKIVDKAVTESKLSSEVVAKLNSAGSNSGVADNSITTNKIANSAVTSTKIASDSVENYHIKSNAITAAKISNYAVTSDKVADGAITTGKIKDSNITSNKLANGAVTFNKLSQEVADKLNNVSSGTGTGAGMINIYYNDLLSLKKSGQLKPGTWYRITDYNFTTVQEGTESANHPFDILVMAISERLLSQEAKAAPHDGNSYFDDCKLDAWKIWYSLENNNGRYSWVDIDKGTGVIYRMIDEYGNDCPYDFKNALFSYKGSYPDAGGTIIGDIAYTRCYTFAVSHSLQNSEDATVLRMDRPKNNIIKPCYNNGSQILNNNVFRCYSNSIGHSNNILEVNCKNNYFDEKCNNNIFGQGCTDNIFYTNCCNNTLKGQCHNIILDDEAENNTLGFDCSVIALERSVGDTHDLKDNIFGNGCNNIFTSGNFTKNILGNGCYFIEFKGYADNNRIDSSCSSLTFNNEIIDSVIGSSSRGCIIGGMYNCVLHQDCTLLTLIGYYRNCTFKSCRNIKVRPKGSDGYTIYNLIVMPSVRNNNTKEEITIDPDTEYEITVARNSLGEIKQYCVADLID